MFQFTEVMAGLPGIPFLCSSGFKWKCGDLGLWTFSSSAMFVLIKFSLWELFMILLLIVSVYIYNTEDIIYMLIQGLYCGINKTKTTWVGTTSFMSSQSFNQLVTIKYNDAVNLKLKVAWIIVKTSSSN